MAYDLGTAHGTIEIEYDGSREVRKAEKDMNHLGKDSDKTSKSLARMGTVLSALGRSTAITGMAVGMASAGIQAANLGIQLAGVVPALASILSLSSALPGLLIGAAATGGILKASLLGVSDAAKAAFDTEHPEKFKKAIKDLSPAAKEFARTLQASVPALKNMQRGIQETFFKSANLTGALKAGIVALKGMKPELTSLTATMGGVVKGFTNFALQARSITFVKNAVKAFEGALKGASSAQTPLLTGLRAVGEVGLPLLKRLGAFVGKLGTQFGDWLSQIAADGRLQTWINTALTTLKQLGGIAKNIGSILMSVFSAAADTGGGLLGTIKTITGEFSKFLSSTAGQEAIRSLFSSIAAVARQLAPVITTLVGALAGALAPALAQIATDVGPVLLQVVKELAPAFKPLAQAAADLISAIAPLVPPLARILSMLVQLAAGVLTTLANALAPVISLIGGALLAAFEQFQPVLDQVIAQLPAVAAAGLQIAQALLPLVPAVLEVAMALAEALLPNLPALMDASLQLIPPLVELAKLFATQLAGALRVVIPFIPVLIGGLVRMATFMNGVLAAGIKLVSGIVRIGIAIFNFGRSVGESAARMVAVVRVAWNAFVATIRNAVNDAVGVARTLPGKITGALRGMGSALVGIGRDIIMGLVNGMKGAVGAAINAAANVGRAILGGVKGALGISSPSKEMIKIGRFINQGLIKGMTGTAKQVQAAANKLGNMVADAYSDGIISKKKKNSVLKTLGKANKQLVGLANKAVTVAAKLKNAQAYLAAVQKSYNEAFNKARDNVRESFSLIGSGQAANDLQDTKARFKLVVEQAKKFAKDIATLVKRGVSRDLIGQLVAAGPQAGGQMAAALATADGKTIAELNALQNELNKAANAVGKSAADAMYGAGLKAAQGLVRGLASQQKAIEALMLKIARGMEKAIKKALHIKSPSKVMFKLGEFISEGLARGIEAMTSEVDKAARTLANATIMPTVQLASGQVPASTVQRPANHSEQTNVQDQLGQDFGPYYLLLDGKVVSGFVVNTITGNPKVVANAAKEGDQQNAWSGSGRRKG
jgi:phage-related protein